MAFIFMNSWPSHHLLHPLGPGASQGRQTLPGLLSGHSSPGGGAVEAKSPSAHLVSWSPLLTSLCSQRKAAAGVRPAQVWREGGGGAGGRQVSIQVAVGKSSHLLGAAEPEEHQMKVIWGHYGAEIRPPSDFLADPVVKTPHFHYMGHGFDPWSGN